MSPKKEPVNHKEKNGIALKLCARCIRAIQSREPLFAGPMILSAEEAEEENIPCEWCGEYDDLYECR